MTERVGTTGEELDGQSWLPRFVAPPLPTFGRPLPTRVVVGSLSVQPPLLPSAPGIPPGAAGLMASAPTSAVAWPAHQIPGSRLHARGAVHTHRPASGPHAPRLPEPVSAPEAAPIIAEIARHSETAARRSVAKLPQITAMFWALKMAGTTLGETSGDFISEGLHLGYLLTFFLVMGGFLIAVSAQVRRGELVPWLYWTVIVATSMAGTEMADFIFHTLGIGVLSVSLGFIAPVVAIYVLGRLTGGSFSVSDIHTRRDEVLYWALILTSNTVGTALGDGLGTTPLGVLGSTIIISVVMGGIYLAYARTSVSRVALFWAAFVLTRPLGATGGDLLWKPHAEGGLGLGRVAVSLALIAFMAVLVRRSTSDLEASRTRRLVPAGEGCHPGAIAEARMGLTEPRTRST